MRVSPLDQITYLVFCRCASLGPGKTAPHNPANFRPIALTSCVGKLFTTMLKNRWLKFMTANNYLNTTVQKALLPGIPGCLEHYHKLLTIIRDAHKKHRSLSVCWLDLANAYRSVPHQLPSALPCSTIFLTLHQ